MHRLDVAEPEWVTTPAETETQATLADLPDIVDDLARRGVIELMPVPRRGWCAAEDCEVVLRGVPKTLAPHEQAVLELFFGPEARPGAACRLRHKLGWLLWHLGPLAATL